MRVMLSSVPPPMKCCSMASGDLRAQKRARITGTLYVWAAQGMCVMWGRQGVRCLVPAWKAHAEEASQALLFA